MDDTEPKLPTGTGRLHGDPDPGVFMMWGALGYHLFGLADAAVLTPNNCSISCILGFIGSRLSSAIIPTVPSSGSRCA